MSAQTNNLYKQSLTIFMSFKATLISHSKKPHLEFFTHNFHSLIPFMQSEALTFMVDGDHSVQHLQSIEKQVSKVNNMHWLQVRA